MNRGQVLDAAIAAIRDDLEALEAMVAMSTDEATNAESKAENKYDTRSLEASYLARGQAERVVALRRLADILTQAPREAGSERVGLLSWVTLEDEEGARHDILLVPDGGGRRIPVGPESVLLLSPQSPAGRSLLGAEVGDAVELGRTEAEVIRLA